MIRILQCVNDMHRAGLETMLMNYYRNIDREKIQFDFLTHRPQRSDYDDEIESLGGKIYYAPRLYPQNYPKYFKWMKQFFSEHPEYKIIHSHIDAMSYLPLKAAKKANIPVRIAHSHNTAIDRDFKYLLKTYFRFKLPKVANYYCACGKEAGEFLFPGKEYMYVPNAIEIDRFLFNENVRMKKRRELGIKDEIVIGHIGRMSYQKNHKYLIDVFAEILKKRNDSILLLIGVGEKLDDIKKYVEKLGLSEQVRFLGNRADVDELYQAMDVFVMPSLFEGLPVVGVEAQFSGLSCIFSDQVPEEVNFTNKAMFISLNEKKDVWADKVIAAAVDKTNRERPELKNSIFNIKQPDILLKTPILTLFTPPSERYQPPGLTPSDTRMTGFFSYYKYTNKTSIMQIFTALYSITVSYTHLTLPTIA